MPYTFRPSFRSSLLVLGLALFALPLTQIETQAQTKTLTQTQPAQPAITLATTARTAPAGAPPDYREFDRTAVGKSSPAQLFTLEFHQASKITGISASPDFKITGSSCSEGHTYSAGDKCSIDLVFTPKGPGHRSGKLTVAHTASARPMFTPIGGSADGPVVSFIPAQITTVPGTYINAGTLGNPRGLAVDGGDNLYIADTGNNLIEFIDSSGALVTLVGGGSNSIVNTEQFSLNAKLNAPYGVAVDAFGNVYYTDNGDEVVGLAFPYGYTASVVGGGTASQSDCNYTTQCQANNVAIDPPTSIAIDTSGTVYFAQTFGIGAPGSWTGVFAPQAQTTAAYFVTGDEYSDLSVYSTSNAITVDPFGYGNLYYAYIDPGVNNGGVLSPTPLCYIWGQNSAATENSATGRDYWNVAGSGPCGFSGDGGKATGAEISNAIGGFAWDAAGNFYFTDTNNNRVRRIDGNTGIIRTVAGNGAAGDSGDGGPATSAEIHYPVGIAVDSQGQIYTTSLAGLRSQADIRRVGTIGQLAFPSQAASTKSALNTVLVSNTGNAPLTFSSISLTSGNTSDFLVDPVSTTCSTTTPLASGDNCQIGVYFTPTTSGARSAVITVYDNTINNSNTILVGGTGLGTTTATLTPASINFGTDAIGTATAAQTATLTNTGTGLLTINSGGIKLSGTNASSYSMTTTCGSTLAAGAKCTIAVKFTPSATGSETATLTVADDATTPSQTVSLTGTGATPAQARVAPASLTFASQTVGTASAVQTFKLSDAGGLPMNVTAFAITGADPGDFSQTNNCPATLASLGSCVISVTFKPAAAGSRTAAVTITTSAGSISEALSGTAVVSGAVKPKVALSSSANPAALGQTVVFRTEVAGDSGAPATGKVQLREGQTVLEEATLTGGTANFRLMGMSPGKHVFQAWYMGDQKNKPSASAAIEQIVGSERRLTLP